MMTVHFVTYLVYGESRMKGQDLIKIYTISTCCISIQEVANSFFFTDEALGCKQCL